MKKTPHAVAQLLDIVGVVALDSHTLSVDLSDGRTVTRDLSALLRRAKVVLRPLRDPKIFRRVRVVAGALTWPGEIDLCPLTTIYGKNWLHSRTVPLALSL